MTETYFASPQRTTDAELLREREQIANSTTVMNLLEGFPDLALILNQHRQLVAFNSKTVEYVPENLRECVYGMRPGEAVDCIHAHEMPAGCGTSKFCVECGAAKALVHTITKNEAAIEECRITRKRNNGEESLDLQVHTTPLSINDRSFTLFSIKDIAADKRRSALEKTFFHDILNTAGALSGLISLLPYSTGQDLAEIEQILPKVSGQLVNEIVAQRQLLSAESGALEPEMNLQSVNEILLSARNLYVGHDVAQEKQLSVQLLPIDISFQSDQTLLIRSIGNLVKNALEASVLGEEVRIFAEVSEQEITFCIRNNSVMPEHVQLQMFQRSFSTKSPNGRGIGTYSVKLLVEQYLKGKVSFVSNEQERTIFTISLDRT